MDKLGFLCDKVFNFKYLYPMNHTQKLGFVKLAFMDAIKSKLQAAGNAMKPYAPELAGAGGGALLGGAIGGLTGDEDSNTLLRILGGGALGAGAGAGGGALYKHLTVPRFGPGDYDMEDPATAGNKLTGPGDKGPILPLDPAHYIDENGRELAANPGSQEAQWEKLKSSPLVKAWEATPWGQSAKRSPARRAYDAEIAYQQSLL